MCNAVSSLNNKEAATTVALGLKEPIDRIVSLFALGDSGMGGKETFSW